MASATLRQDFDACVTLFKDFLAQSQTSTNVQQHNISEVSTKRPGNDKKGEVEDRYYTSQEYKALTNAQKLALMKKREKRGHTGKPGDKGKSKLEKEISNLKRNISMLKQAKQDDTVTTANSSDTETESENDEPAIKTKKASKAKITGQNRKNSALTRQKKGK